MSRSFFSRVFMGAFAVCVLGGMFGITSAHAQSVGSGSVIELTVLNPTSTTTYDVTVSKTGTGSGTVTSGDGNIVCGVDCFELNIPDASSTVLTAVADPDSTFAGWSFNGDPTVCPGTGTCSASSSGLVTATFNLIVVIQPPPPAPPNLTQPIVTSPSGPSQLIFEDFSSEIGTTSIIMNWYTSLPTVSTINWGTDSDGSNGSGSEDAYGTIHSIELDNLTPGTAYHITLQATSQSGDTVTYSYNFRTLPITNSVPLNVDAFHGQVSFGGNILLSWQNPPESDFESVTITRGIRFFPRDINEGYLVYQGPEEEALDTSAVPGQAYYYAAFVTTTEGAHSSGTLLQYGLPFTSTSTAVLSTGNPSLSPTSTPLFGGAVASGSAATNIGGPESQPSLLSDIIFIQNDKPIAESGSDVTVQASLPILVEIPSFAVPANTEETTITVAQNSANKETFMFQKLSDGSLQAFVPAILPPGSTNFTIHFLQEGSEIRVNGTFIASGEPAPFVPQGLFSYLYQTYISNNFIPVTLPAVLSIFGFLIILLILAVIIRILLKRK